MLIEREHSIKKAHRCDLFVEREQGKQKKAQTEEAQLGRRGMVATSSIRKQFIAKDRKAFERLLKEAEKTPARKITAPSPSLEEGRKALKRFSFR